MNKYLEKIAKYSSEEDLKPRSVVAKSMAGAMLSGIVGTAAIGTLGNIPMYREIKSSGKKYGISNQTIKAFNEKHGLNVQHAQGFDQFFHQGGPAVAPAYLKGEPLTEHAINSKKWKNFVLYGKHHTDNNGIWMHELGHAKDLSENTGRKMKMLALGRTAGGPLPTMLLGAALGANEKTEDYAPAASLLAVPTLHAEHRANMAAYHHLKDVKGAKTAGRFLRGIASKNMLGYAANTLAPGIVAGLSAKALAQHYRKREAERISKLKSK